MNICDYSLAGDERNQTVVLVADKWLNQVSLSNNTDIWK